MRVVVLAGLSSRVERGDLLQLLFGLDYDEDQNNGIRRMLMNTKGSMAWIVQEFRYVEDIFLVYKCL